MTKLVRSCSIWRALEVIGDSATILIIESAWLGARTFTQFQQSTGLRRALLSSRLKRLVELEVMARKPYSHKPLRHEYRLTRMGLDLYPNSLMMLRWERLWGDRSKVVEVRLTHRICGQEFEPIPMCMNCGKEYDAHQTSWEEGPGVGAMPASYVRRRQRREVIAERPQQSALMVDIAQIIGDRWATLILRSLFTGLNSFEKIREDSGIASNILSERLVWMRSMGLIELREKDEHRAQGYRLTPKGLDIFPIMMELLKWGDHHFAAPEGPPLLLFHQPDGHKLDNAVCCSACHRQLDVFDVSYELEWEKGKVAGERP